MKTATYKAIRTVTTSWVVVSQFSFQDRPYDSKKMSEADARALEASTKAEIDGMSFDITVLRVESRETEVITPVSRDEYEACLERAAAVDCRIVPEIIRTDRIVIE